MRSKWVDPMGDTLTRAKYKEIADKQADTLVAGFGREFPEIMNYIQLE